jgi:transglutaminase/protease-like cytokinesis protein 3
LVWVIAYQLSPGQKFAAIDAFAGTIPIQQDCRKITEKLIAPYTEDEQKVRAIFSWIVQHIEYDPEPLQEFRETGKREKTVFSYSNEAELRQQRDAIMDASVEKTLRTKKGVCMDYANLFIRMCQAADIEAVYINGFGRFDPGTIGKTHSTSNHAWNAVKIGNEWKLVDVTWSTGMGFTQESRHGFFLTDPQFFIMTHHPTDVQWQLLDSTVSIEEFALLPFLHNHFVEYEIVDLNPRTAYLPVKENSTISISFRQPPKRLVLMDGERPSDITPVRDGNTFTFDFKPKYAVPRPVHIAIVEGDKILPIVTYKTR